VSRKIETNAKVLIGSCLCLLAGKCRKFGKPQLYTGAKKKRNKKLKTHRKVGGGKRGEPTYDQNILPFRFTAW